MEVFLSEEELEREKHLFSPHEIAYILDGEGFVVALYEEKVSQEVLDEAPMSC
jgi:hypothetical protein